VPVLLSPLKVLSLLGYRESEITFLPDVGVNWLTTRLFPLPLAIAKGAFPLLPSDRPRSFEKVKTRISFPLEFLISLPCCSLFPPQWKVLLFGQFFSFSSLKPTLFILPGR